LFDYLDVEKELIEDDSTLLRFLRARKVDIPKAADMFLAYLEWRRDYKLDSNLAKVTDEMI